MSNVAKTVKVLSVRNTEDFVIVTFDDGQEFAYPASILHSVIPPNPIVARQVQEIMLRTTREKTQFVH
ncbi:hypothetical protein Terro_1095 [Terriglobus roseus DSM 18391]|uniref:Uncharacterized protein n=1 Tax=Terriglobus roseus (strain DSM 18391 / NRRL B-41598 / KBS 63) TaxID=926566 RepID=I3ZDU7_TERRK|nr:hypothetical protein [Terriglobus roseus]AFL87415.1 hypothetical protein Terro_1095 [Terriglobus roseus DSM 18391]